MMKTINKRNKHHINMSTIKEIVMSQRQKRRANLRRADLRGADLRRANLRRADLRGADLRGADLRGADLSGANLSGANLRGANLRGADLRGANLMEADLMEANLMEADLIGVSLWGTENIYVFTAYDTSKRLVYCVKHKYTWYVKAGCFWGTLAELKTRVLETHNSKVYLHNISLLEQL